MTDTPRPSRDSIGLADLKRALGPDRSEEEVSEEEIVAYHHGELAEERAEEVLAFLAADPEWESALADARDPEAVAAQSGVEDDATIDAAWQDFQSRLYEIEEPPEPGKIVEFPQPPAPQPAPTPPQPNRKWLLAAVFVVAALLGTFFGRLILAPLGPTDSNVRLVELEPLRPEAGPLLGNEDTAAYPSMGGELLVLKLWPPTLLERDGQLPDTAPFRLLRNTAVVRQGAAELQDGAYVTSLPADGLMSGEYRIELDLGSLSGGDPGTYQYELRWQVDSP